MSGTTRRRLLGALAAGAALGALPRGARAIGGGSKFRIGELQIPGALSTPRPSALARMLWEVEVRTSIDAARDPIPVSPTSERLFETPFLYLAGDRRFAPLPAAAIANLRRFLTFGGFLLVDSAEGRAGGEFDGAVRQLVADLFPSPAPGLLPIADDHVIHKSFYLTSSTAGRVAVAPALEGVAIGGRTTLVYGQNDLAGAWAKDEFGKFLYQCHPGGELQREHAFRLGINLVMYALCLDYKADQVHVPFILKRRRWRTDVP